MMDIREAYEWVTQKKQEEFAKKKLEALLYDVSERTQMTDEQWRKLKALSSCKLWAYDKGFVHCLLNLPIDSPITGKQSAYIETIWLRYRKQHKYQLAEPYWVYELASEKTQLWYNGKTYSQEWYEEKKGDEAHQYCQRQLSEDVFK